MGTEATNSGMRSEHAGLAPGLSAHSRRSSGFVLLRNRGSPIVGRHVWLTGHRAKATMANQHSLSFIDEVDTVDPSG